MVSKPNFSKIAVVVFITVLIWVWADLAMDERLVVSHAAVTVAKSTNPGLWVSFNNEPSVVIDTITLKGPASKIAEARRKLNDGTLKLEFFLVPEQEGIVKPGENTLDVLGIIRDSDQIRQLGLAVESCSPNKLTVNAVTLVKKQLVVKCVDAEQNQVEAAIIEPAQVDMFVPADWSGEKLTAKAQLARGEINQARIAAVEKTPYIELAAGQIREVPIKVKITTPPQEDILRAETIKNATLGFNLSALLQGKYKVEVINLNEVIGAIAIRATPEAKRSYESMRYQVILEIDDSDKDIQSAEPLRKELIYNFPSEYIRKNEIMLNQQPVIARFKLIPLPSEEAIPAKRE